MRIIILSKNSGGQQLWQEIEDSQLKRWLKDGSIREGDKVVYPDKIMEVVATTTLSLEKKE